jgi:hypothetical protein
MSIHVGNSNLFRTNWRAALVMASVALALTFSQGTSLAAAKKSLVDINTASQAELEAVKGLGPATAKKRSCWCCGQGGERTSLTASIADLILSAKE